jgi:hypothetical protein
MLSRLRSRPSPVSSSRRPPPRSPAGRRHVAVHLHQRHLEMEGGAVARLGMHADGAAHQLDDPLADRKPQAGAAIQPGGRGVGLGECVEQPLLRGRLDADAGVAHLEAQPVLGALVADPAHLIETEPRSVNLTALPTRLPRIWRSRTGSPRTGSRTPGSMCRCRRRPLDSAERSISCSTPSSSSRRLNGRGFQLELVGLELGIVEDVVDDPQQLLRGAVGRAHQLVLVGLQPGGQQQVEHRHDAVERGADLVAHGGEEFALGHHRRLGRLLGLQQVAFERVAAVELALQLLDLGFLAPRALVQLFELPALAADRQRQVPPAPPAPAAPAAARPPARGRPCPRGPARARRRCRRWRRTPPRAPRCRPAPRPSSHSTACWKSKSRSPPACCTRLPWM